VGVPGTGKYLAIPIAADEPRDLRLLHPPARPAGWPLNGSCTMPWTAGSRSRTCNLTMELENRLWVLPWAKPAGQWTSDVPRPLRTAAAVLLASPIEPQPKMESCSGR
jgi:hypothetical protein